MTKRNRNIKNIFIMLQRDTDIMANKIKTQIQNYFEFSSPVTWRWQFLLLVHHFQNCYNSPIFWVWQKPTSLSQHRSMLWFVLSLDYSKKSQGRNLKCQIFIQHFFKIVLYLCLDLICHNVGIPLKHNKYIFDIPIPFCHNLCSCAVTKRCVFAIPRKWESCSSFENDVLRVRTVNVMLPAKKTLTTRPVYGKIG
jgi:hypothetical protein